MNSALLPLSIKRAILGLGGELLLSTALPIKVFIISNKLNVPLKGGLEELIRGVVSPMYAVPIFELSWALLMASRIALPTVKPSISSSSV